MSDEPTDTKVPDAAQEKSGAAPAPKPAAAKPKPKKAAAKDDFGDPGLTAKGLEPIGFEQRTRAAWQHGLDVFGLVLSPTQLAILLTMLPLVDATKPALLGVLGGMLLGAMFAVLIATPLLRYGLSLGVLSRSAYGVRGALIVPLVRVILGVGFFAHAAVIAVLTLMWCTLCLTPVVVPAFQRVPLLGTMSLITVIGAFILGITVWAFARELKRGTAIALLVPGVVLLLALFLMPGNLPLGTAWGMVDLVERAQTDNVAPVIIGAALWSASLFTLPVNEARKVSTQLGQSVSVLASVVPWLLGGLGYALAVLSSGKSDTGFFDLPALACRRLSSPWLVLVLTCSTVALLWPMALSAKRSVQLGMLELVQSPKVRRAGEYTLLGLALLGAVLVRGGLVRYGYEALLGLAWLHVVLVACVIVHYFVVERARLVLDDLYTYRGRYRGVLGVSPSGVLAIAGGCAAVVWASKVGYLLSIGAALGIGTAALLYVVLASVQRLIQR
ncbi:MAG: cytosine permease [Deltaproteobacteria bacterium]|nr:cytosine permease [Deltaproteobacteria bacterium]